MNDVTEYEFRERTIGDRRKWEDIPLIAGCRLTYFAFENPPQVAAELASALALFPNVVEIRFNVAGSLQGHYVPGPDKAREQHRSQGEQI